MFKVTMKISFINFDSTFKLCPFFFICNLTTKALGQVQDIKNEQLIIFKKCILFVKIIIKIFVNENENF
jgi:hypothetical protein